MTSRSRTSAPAAKHKRLAQPHKMRQFDLWLGRMMSNVYCTTNRWAVYAILIAVAVILGVHFSGIGNCC